jgi:hypothetical protein
MYGAGQRVMPLILPKVSLLHFYGYCSWTYC